ncbi:hypothetical protein N7454_004949 [Penicillium verhagenii]|nr:hypothetical protein N7454_004949 [Penicillium verhagenii]
MDDLAGQNVGDVARLYPLSLVASIIAVATVAAQISEAISNLRGLGKLPDQLYALKNEVTDLGIVLRQIGDSIEQSDAIQGTDSGSLREVLQRAKEKLAELAKVLGSIADACIGGKTKIVNRAVVWWKEKGHLQALQDDICTVKATLNLMLGASHSHGLNHVQLELREVFFVTSDSAQKNETYTNTLGQDFSKHQMELSARLQQHYQGLDHRLDCFEKLILQQRTMEESSHRVPQQQNFGFRATGGGTHIEAVQIQVAQYGSARCRSWCPCLCHSRKKVSLPGMTELMLGKMFLGYAGLPLLNKKCDFPGCKRRQSPSLTMEYWFPWWFLARNVKMQLSYERNFGPQLQMTMLRRIPDSAQSIKFALQGNIEGLKYLFSQGLASPRDVSDSRGFTLLRWALYNWHYETVQFLIEAGAHVDEISYENVWDFILRGKISPEKQTALRCITVGSDWVEEQNFPLVHQIVFGMSSKALEIEVMENPHAIYQKDVQGRTALNWAAARGQEEHVRILLSYGADPDSMDITGRTVLHQSADSCSAECTRLVLEAGGNPNPVMPVGILRSTPLFAAVRNCKDTLIVKHLLEFNADVNGCGPEGITPLHDVARSLGPHLALLLLEYKADLNVTTRDGRTPITMAIIYNNHEVLKLLLDRWYQYTLCPRSRGLDLLQTVAGHADLETITILAKTPHLKSHRETSANTVISARETLQQRPDKSEDLTAAFEELIAIIEAEPPDDISEEDLMESGFLSCRSTWNAKRESLENLEMTEKDVDSDVDTVESERWEDAKEVFEALQTQVEAL